MNLRAALPLLCGWLLSGCAHQPGRAWYQPSALTVGITAPNLISSPPVTNGRGTRHNSSLSQIGAVVSLTFPLFPTPTQPQRPPVPAPPDATLPPKHDGQP